MNVATIGEVALQSFIVLEDKTDHKNWKRYIDDGKRLFVMENGVPHVVLYESDHQLFITTVVKVIPSDVNVIDSLQIIGNDNVALIKDEENNFIGYITQHTISKSLQNEYEKLSKFIEIILNTIDGSCTAIDQDANVICWTKGAEKIFGIEKKDIIGKPITDFFTRDHLVILNSLLDGESLKSHQHYARDDLIVLINSNPVEHHDEIIGAVVAETDVTNMIRLNNELYKTSERLFDLEEQMRKISTSKNPFVVVKGSSNHINQTINIAKKAAKTDANVLILGESGVGKEVFAKAIHQAREKESAPFIAINCGAISSSLFESEIFGYEKGAFSGADEKGKKGKAELAQGGTLFLDEIGEMPLDMQVKFLRLLQEKKFYRVGGTKEVSVDFRIIAATNKNLFELVNKGEFREDLYYRLNVVHLTIPPLRDRPQDIIELTHYFLYEMSIKYNRPIHGISQNVMQRLLNHHWPGNIRELRNVVERMVVFSEEEEITTDNLPYEFGIFNDKRLSDVDYKRNLNLETLSEQLEYFEREIILRELNRADGNKLKCANHLGITRATLYNRMKKLNIEY